MKYIPKKPTKEIIINFVVIIYHSGIYFVGLSFGRVMANKNTNNV